jgi:heterodisulfide reductase subunit B
MKYLYYQGCSLEGSAREYDLSTRALMAAAGAQLIEIEDWTCCGASAAEAVSHYLALALPARNLALAERQEDAADILVPCSACYLNLKKVAEQAKKDPRVADEINAMLSADGLQLTGSLRVRHLLEVLLRDVGAGFIARKRTCSLEGLTIAPYYGCQCLRPYAVFDDPEKPRSMEALIEATGAAVHAWDMGGMCCGASHMNTKMEVGLQLVHAILEQAAGADAIVTVCPMCQMNLEGYQAKVSKLGGQPIHMSVIYLPQLLGLALGLPDDSLRLDLNLSVQPEFLAKIQAAARAA